MKKHNTKKATKINVPPPSKKDRYPLGTRVAVRDGMGELIFFTQKDGALGTIVGEADNSAPMVRFDNGDECYVCVTKIRPVKSENNAKQRHEKRAALRKLTPQARRCVLALRAARYAFGCQGDSVVALVSAIVGKDLKALVEAP